MYKEVLGKLYVESLYSRSDLPPDLPLWVNCGHKIADLILLPYVSFIIAYTAFI